MQTRAAVIYDMEKTEPYASSQPMLVEALELDRPAAGEVLVELVGAGLCHSDLSTINGSRPRPLPMVLGHEASGIVREVGTGVSDLQPDDRVVFSFVPMCGSCYYCAIGRPALCEKGALANAAGTLMGGGVRFHKAAGEPVLHHLGVSAFSQFTVASQHSLIKIDQEIPLDKAALFGCALLTGVGAVMNTAHVQAGEPVVVFGLGGVGLSAIMGAKLAGAWPIVAVDMLESKFDLAQRVGADYTVKADEKTVAAVRDLTNGGAEYAFEAVGNARVLAQAYEATRRGGKTISIGLPHPNQQLSIQAVSLVAQEKTLMGSYMGSAVPRRDIPRLINLYLAGKLPVDLLLSPSIRLDEINVGFDRLAQGTAIRQLIHF